LASILYVKQLLFSYKLATKLALYMDKRAILCYKVNSTGEGLRRKCG